MNKILVAPIVVIVLGIFTHFAAAATISESYNPDTGKIRFSLAKGWNMIPSGTQMWPSGYENGGTVYENTCRETIKGGYAYSPVQNKYLGGYYSGSQLIYVPSNSQEILQNEKNSKFYHAMDYLGGGWIYSTSYCYYDTNLQPKSAYSSAVDAMNEITIKKGWNFITAAPFMIDLKFKDVFSSCNVLGVNIWNDANQKWSFASSTAQLASMSDYNFYTSGVGEVLVVKVADDCHLLGAGGITPPPIPP